MEKETLKSKRNFVEKTKEFVIEEDLSFEDLEKSLDLLSEKVKYLAKKNGFSKKLKKRVEQELI